MEHYVLENEKISAVIREKSAELISLKRKDNGQEYLWNADKKFWLDVSHSVSGSGRL